jgi:hypothetical protein
MIHNSISSAAFSDRVSSNRIHNSAIALPQEKQNEANTVLFFLSLILEFGDESGKHQIVGDLPSTIAS